MMQNKTKANKITKLLCFSHNEAQKFFIFQDVLKVFQQMD